MPPSILKTNMLGRGMTRPHLHCDGLPCRRGFRGTGVGSPNRGYGGEAPRMSPPAKPSHRGYGGETPRMSPPAKPSHRGYGAKRPGQTYASSHTDERWSSMLIMQPNHGW